jgi:hypothetical protein
MSEPMKSTPTYVRLELSYLNRLVTLLPIEYKARQGSLPSSATSRNQHPINQELRYIQDIWYYAQCGLNLSKLCVTCLSYPVCDLDPQTHLGGT